MTNQKLQCNLQNTLKILFYSVLNFKTIIFRQTMYFYCTFGTMLKILYQASAFSL